MEKVGVISFTSGSFIQCPTAMSSVCFTEKPYIPCPVQEELVLIQLYIIAMPNVIWYI